MIITTLGCCICRHYRCQTDPYNNWCHNHWTSCSKCIVVSFSKEIKGIRVEQEIIVKSGMWLLLTKEEVYAD